jgi:hypothetical protein
LRRLVEYPAGGTVQSLGAIAARIGCIMVSAPGTTASTLVAPAVATTTLDQAAVTFSTLANPDLC